MLTKTLVFLIPFAIATAAFAAPAAVSGNHDYNWVINNLKSFGISPSRVQWGQIDELCLPFKSDGTYEDCRLEKAQSQVEYDDDALMCTDNAAAFNPTTVRYKAIAMTGTEETGIQTTVTYLNSIPAVGSEEAFRHYVFDRCMREQGWKNPRDYRRGRKG